MRCYTFFQCQLRKGLLITKFVPPNNERLRGPAKDVLFLGQYGKKHESGMSNIARNINLDKDGPATIVEVTDSSRIIFNPFGKVEPSYDQEKCRVVMTACPRRIPRGRADGTDTYFVVLSQPDQFSNNVLVRINTSSTEMITNRRGRWERVLGRAAAVSRSRSVREENGVTSVSWADDLVVLHDRDMVRVITEGSEEIDDQILMNVNGHIIMLASVILTMSGMEPETQTAEQLERDMALALAERDSTPTELSKTGTEVLDRS